MLAVLGLIGIGILGGAVGSWLRSFRKRIIIIQPIEPIVSRHSAEKSEGDVA